MTKEPEPFVPILDEFSKCYKSSVRADWSEESTFDKAHTSLPNLSTMQPAVTSAEHLALDFEANELVGKYKAFKISGEMLWDQLQNASLSSEQRRHIFWDHLREEDRLLLLKRCSYFDPRDKVWASGDLQAARAQSQISRVMKSLSGAKRAAHYDFIGAVCVSVLLVLFITLAILGILTFPLVAVKYEFDVPTLSSWEIALLFISAALSFYIGLLYVSHEKIQEELRLLKINTCA